MRKFFIELKRRHLYSVAIYYTAAARLSVQIADVVLENFNLPERVMQLIILVVVPFDNLSEESLDDISVSGFTEDLTTLLAQVPGFFVISRNTAFRFPVT